jgi:hypothetical protein
LLLVAMLRRFTTTVVVAQLEPKLLALTGQAA